MKKILTKIIGASLAITMMIGVGAGVNAAKEAKEANADDGEYTITFSNNANSATAISSTTNASTVIATASAGYVTSKPFSNISGKVYYGDTKTCIRLGKSGESSSITIALSNNYNYSSGEKEYSKISVLCDKMTGNKNANAKISVNGLTAQAAPATGSAAAVEFDLTTTNIDSFSLSGDASIYVYSVTLIEKSGDSSTVESVSASIKDGEYYVGDKLSPSDFNVTASWTGDKADTNPTSGFTWTVNDVTDGELVEGDNTVVLTYQEVSSQPFNVVAIVEPGTVPNNPLSVANAVTKGSALSTGNETAKTYYIQGIVSEIITNQLGNGSYATFWLQNGNTAHGFEAYQITAADGCSNYGDLRVGAEVLLKCKILKYNSTTIETGSDKSLLSIFYVVPTLEGVVLNKSSLKLEAGKYETLTVSPDPIGAELGDVTWESSNTDVATVDGNGKVTGVAAGSATITATAGGFTATCDVLVELCAELDLTTNGAFTTVEDELLICEVTNKLTLRVDKNTSSTNANNYYPGKSNYTSTRFYTNQIVTLTPNNNLVGVRAEFTAKSNTYAKALKNSAFTNATAAMPDETNGVVIVVTFIDGMKPFNVTVGANCGFESVKLFYLEKTARQKVETNLETQSMLSYHYVKENANYSYSNISMRFGGSISKDLWNELDTDEHLIAGVGVMITGYDEQLRTPYSIKDHAAEAVPSTEEHNINTQVVDYYVALSSLQAMPEKNNEYYWNLKYSIDSIDDMLDAYTAAAYIKLTNGELVFLKQVKYSVWSLAKDYLDNRNCDEETAGGSLYNLVNNMGLE